mmetsp:Transcript_28258/g.84540  ORF Transcript_28258/g.84540 Transcript_28258/m.84540 type:complete len:219 (+) Transcript_28258:1328-1984(+)
MRTPRWLDGRTPSSRRPSRPTRPPSSWRSRRRTARSTRRWSWRRQRWTDCCTGSNRRSRRCLTSGTSSFAHFRFSWPRLGRPPRTLQPPRRSMGRTWRRWLHSRPRKTPRSRPCSRGRPRSSKPSSGATPSCRRGWTRWRPTGPRRRPSTKRWWRRCSRRSPRPCPPRATCSASTNAPRPRSPTCCGRASPRSTSRPRRLWPASKRRCSTRTPRPTAR